MSLPGGLRLQLQELAQAIDQAALQKSAFYTEIRKEILLATAETDADGQATTIDDMLTALQMINTRSGKMASVSDAFIRRIQRAARYVRILENATLKNHPQKPETDSKDSSQPETDSEDSPQKKSSPSRYPNQTNLLRQIAREDVAIVVKNIVPDATKFQSPLSLAGLKAAGHDDGSEQSALTQLLSASNQPKQLPPGDERGV